jgi:hypothetical protein
VSLGFERGKPAIPHFTLFWLQDRVFWAILMAYLQDIAKISIIPD